MKRWIFTLLASTCLAGFSGLATPGYAADGSELVIAQTFDPTSLWPNYTTNSDEINAAALITEPLFWQDSKTGTLTPVLALGYKVVEPTVIEVKLREGVRFTNEEEFNAAAVVNTFNIFMDRAQTPAYGIYADAFESISIVDEHTVRLHTKYPYPAIELALTKFYIVPPAYWAEVGADGFGKQPVGTGPYMLTEWRRDDRIIYDANPTYWGTVPKGIDRVVLRPVPDEISRAAGVEAGEFDIATGISITSATDIEGAGKSIVEVPSFRIFTLILYELDKHDSPLKDKRVRQAINYAIDKDGIREGLFEGRVRPLHGQLLRDNQLGFNDQVEDYPYDPARAKELLTEAGYPNGFPIEFKFPAGRYAQDQETASAIAGMLRDVGIEPKLTQLEAGEFLRQLTTQDLGPIGYIGLGPADDPGLQMGQYHSTWRYSYMSNSEVDRLIDAGAREIDTQKRAEIYKQLAVIMHEEAPVAFLFQNVDLYAVSPHVHGFLPRGEQLWSLYGVSLED